jgi:three-Cys-motif partner protein
VLGKIGREETSVKSIKRRGISGNNHGVERIKPRSTQTKVKHTILNHYLRDWGSIIINGLKQFRQPIYLVYVDCNAYTGRYSRDIENIPSSDNPQPIFGTPIIGVRGLDMLVNGVKKDENVEIHTNVILIEKDEKNYLELKRSLRMAGLLPRVRETDDFASLRNGEIALLCEDSIHLAPRLIRYTQAGFKFSLFLLDPYGPKGIPFTFVKEIIRQPRHDVIINMPYQDLHKKSGMALKLELRQAESEIVKNYDAMFGHTGWQSIVREIAERAKSRELKEMFASEETSEVLDLELALMQCYRKALLSTDPDLSVKSIELHFPDRERTMFYLYLTTHDPNGALAMNKVLWDAKYQEHELRWKLRDLRRNAHQLPLWGDSLSPPVDQSPRATIEDIAKRIQELLGGKSLSKRDVYAALADEPYFANEINKALTFLKGQDLASYQSPVKNNTLISIKKA